MAICWSLQDSCGTLTWLHMIILVLQDSWMHGRTFYKTNMILWSHVSTRRSLQWSSTNWGNDFFYGHTGIANHFCNLKDMCLWQLTILPIISPL